MKKRRYDLTGELDPSSLISALDNALYGLGGTIAMEAPLDVTGDTAAGTNAALGPNSRTGNDDNNDDIKTDANSPSDLLSEEDDNTGEEDTGDTNEENDDDTDNPDETGEEDPGAEDGGDGTDTAEDDNAPVDDSDDPEGIKKRRLMENMETLHDMIQKNAAMLSKSNVSTISAIVGKANSRIISILNSTADIIHNILTDGTWEKTPYPQLMQKYVGLNMVFDLTVKMLEENVLSAEKERERNIQLAKRQAARARRSLNRRAAGNLDQQGFTGQRP